jgi:carboxymethylenebutenolidase
VIGMAREITTEWVRLGAGPDAYLAAPVTGEPLGGVVAGAEMFGLTDHARDVCDRLARAGYVALAPDFYWRESRLARLGYDDAGRAEARRLMLGLDRDGVLSDVSAALDAATGRAGRGGRAMVGLSLAGHIAVLAATRIPLDVAVAFYAGWTLDGGIPLAEPDPPLAHSDAIAANGTFVLGFVGGQDFLVPPGEWRAIEERLTSSGVEHELVAYPQAAHGFACPQRPETYDHEATVDAWRRVLAVLGERVAANAPA